MFASGISQVALAPQSLRPWITCPFADARRSHSQGSFRISGTDIYLWLLEDLATQIYHWDVYKNHMEKFGAPRAKYLSLRVAEWFTGLRQQVDGCTFHLL